MTPFRSDAASAEALAALGKIREILAAARNLEHLATSRAVGPKVLAQVIPEVGLALASFGTQVSVLKTALLPSFGSDAQALDSLRALAQPEVDRLSELLARLAVGALNAKPRLELEEQLRLTLPQLVSAVAHWELLVEAQGAEPLTMSVEELLSSAPARSSDRPHRPVPVQGDLSNLFVEIPPRAGLRCLAAWMSQGDEPFSGEGLLVVGGNDFVEFSRGSCTSSDLTLRLPVFFPSVHTFPVVGAALALHRGRLHEGTLSLKKVVGTS